MKKTIVSLVAVAFLSSSCDQSHLQQAQAPVQPGLTPWGRDLLSRKESEDKTDNKLPSAAPAAQVPPKDPVVEGRRKLIPAISAAFARRTSAPRAKWLAEVCFQKTLGT